MSLLRMYISAKALCGALLRMYRSPPTAQPVCARCSTSMHRCVPCVCVCSRERMYACVYRYDAYSHTWFAYIVKHPSSTFSCLFRQPRRCPWTPPVCVFKMCVKIYCPKHTLIHIHMYMYTSRRPHDWHDQHTPSSWTSWSFSTRSDGELQTTGRLKLSWLRQLCERSASEVSAYMAAYTQTTRYNNIHRHKETDPHTKTNFQNK